MSWELMLHSLGQPREEDELMHRMLPTKVACYAGSRYPERPTALFWEGRRVAVEAVEAEWQTPGARHFQVETAEGKFHLRYDGQEDAWYAGGV